MKSYLQMVRDIEVQLQRELTMEEMKFLQWVFKRYMEEKEEQEPA